MYQDRVLPMLSEILAAAGWNEAPLNRLEIIDNGLSLATPWPVTVNAIAVLAAVGLAASHLEELRTGRKRPVRIDTRQAGLAMASSTYLRVNGENAKFSDPFTGTYEAANGRYVFLHGNFPHLRDGLMKLIGARDVEDVARAVKERDAFEIEREAIAANLCAAAVRTRAEWLEEPQAGAVQSQPLLSIEKIGPGPTRVFGPGSLALEGLRVLDLTRVIAGPTGGRTLAEHGADTLLISGPGLPSIPSLVIDTGFGKRSAEIDLKSGEGRRLFDGLIDDVDVFLDAYRPGALEALGYTPDALAQKRPGIVHVDLTAFSNAGPWRTRRGYDSLVQATTGMVWDGVSKPRHLPCQPLDYLTGYLIAFGAMAALIRQASEGGSWSVKLSLARTAEWMWSTYESAGAEEDYPQRNPTADEVADLIATYQTGFGEVAALKPPLQAADWRWPRASVPLGSDAAAWR